MTQTVRELAPESPQIENESAVDLAPRQPGSDAEKEKSELEQLTLTATANAAPTPGRRPLFRS